MPRKKIIRGLFLVLLLLPILGFKFTLESFATNDKKETELILPYEKVNPKDGFKYGLKRLSEKTFLFLLTPFPSRKVDYYNNLLERRLAELRMVVENKDIGNIQTASQRYSTTAGELVKLIQKKNLDGSKQSAVKTFASHMPILEKWQHSYNFDSAEWKFIKYDIDYLKEYSSQLSKN